MKVQSTLSGVILVCLLLSSAQAITYFNATFDTYIGHQAIYDLGYLGNDTTVVVNISNTASGAGSRNVSDLTVQLLNPTLATAATPINSTDTAIVTCIASTSTTLVGSYVCLTTNTSGSNTNYMLRIGLSTSPTDTGYLQYYQVVVKAYFNTSTITNGTSDGSAQARTLFQGTEVIRNKVVKLLYFKDKGSVNISFYPNYNSGSFDLTLSLWRVAAGTGSIYAPIGSAQTAVSVSSGGTRTINNVTNLTNVIYNITTTGYYILNAIPNPTPAAAQRYIRLIFPSDSYTCPFNSNFPDYRQNFQPCLGSSAGGGGSTPTPIVPGYPCLVYDQTAAKCSQCANGFTLSETGTCLYNTTCPSRQYYRFGVCYDVNPKCNTFDPFTGDCLTCISALDYVVNGSCIPNPALIPKCENRQYLLNNKCVDVSPLCKEFDPKTGQCTSCIEKYVLAVASGSCFPRGVNCNATQYVKNGECFNYPANCANFDVSKQRCVLCNFGYYPNNAGCQKIICIIGKVPSKNGLFCIDVSPSCNQAGQYDTLTGDCLKCKNDGYTVKDGICVQNINPISSCAARVSLGFSACPDAKVNCQFYNLVTADCDQCFPGFFKDYTGVCSLRNDNSKCGGDQVSIQGYCVQKPANCRLVDNLGLCTTCNGNQYQLQNGQCVEIKRCASGQYLNPDNACVNVPAGCNNGGFNPTTGVCLTCNDGKPAVNGLCCTGNLVAYQGQCITAAQFQSIYTSASGSEIPICISFHPTLGYCLQCNGNFQVDPTTMNSCI